MRARVALICLLVLIAIPAQAFGAVTGAQVAAMTAEQDGDQVTLEGEVVGDILKAGQSHVWLAVLSDGTAVGVWTPEKVASEVGVLGKHGVRGDTVRVTGIFNFTCSRHGGDLDVHLDEMRVLQRGEALSTPIRWWKLPVSLAALLVAGAGALYGGNGPVSQRAPLYRVVRRFRRF